MALASISAISWAAHMWCLPPQPELGFICGALCRSKQWCRSIFSCSRLVKAWLFCFILFYYYFFFLRMCERELSALKQFTEMGSIMFLIPFISEGSKAEAYPRGPVLFCVRNRYTKDSSSPFFPFPRIIRRNSLLPSKILSKTCFRTYSNLP